MLAPPRRCSLLLEEAWHPAGGLGQEGWERRALWRGPHIGWALSLKQLGEGTLRQAGLKGWGERGGGEQIHSGSFLRLWAELRPAIPKPGPLPVSHD